MESKIQVERRKNNFYKTLFDVSLDAIVIVDLENNYSILDANDKALSLFGYSYEEMVKLSYLDLSSNPERTKISIEDGTVYVDLRWYRKKDGTSFPIEGTASHFDIDGRKSLMLTIRDITARKAANDALAASEAKYRAIVEDQLELICRFTIDGNLTFVNKAYCDYFDKKYEDIIGKPFMDLIFDEDKEFVENSFNSITKEKPYNHYDRRVILSNGEIKWTHWSNRAIFCENGNIKEYQSIGFDITDRKHLEEKVLKSKLRYRAILDNLHEGFYQTDLNGNVCFVSQSALEIMGYNNRQELLGKPVRNYFLKPEERGLFIQRLKDAGGKLYDQELELVNKNNETIIISLNYQFAYDNEGNITGTQGIFRDITESKMRMSEIIKLYQVVEGSQNAIVVFEIDGTITYSNKALLKIARSPDWVTLEEHAIGKKIKKFLSFDKPDTLISVYETAEKTGKWFGPAYLFCACSEHERIPINLMISKITDEENKIHYVASFYDTTERRALENKIKEQSRMYEELQNEMSVLVGKMNIFNDEKFAKLSYLEEAFERSVQDFKNEGGQSLNASIQ